MKHLLLLSLFICSVAFAQDPVTKNIGDYHTLKVFNGLHVELKKSGSSKVEIEGAKSDDVVIKNSDGVLKIRLQFPDSFTAEGVRIVLYYNKPIQVLDANEGAEIHSEKTIKQKQLEVKVQEGAKIITAVNVDYLTVKSVTGGLIKLSGSTGNQNVEATTGGIYEGYELKSDHASVTAASGAQVRVTASDFLDARVRFGGNIYYMGNPETLKTKKVIGGSIKPASH